MWPSTFQAIDIPLTDLCKHLPSFNANDHHFKSLNPASCSSLEHYLPPLSSHHRSHSTDSPEHGVSHYPINILHSSRLMAGRRAIGDLLPPSSACTDGLTLDCPPFSHKEIAKSFQNYLITRLISSSSSQNRHRLRA